MCGCEPGFVCTRCTGDPRQDWRMLVDGDEPERWQQEQEDAERLARRLTNLRGDT